MTAASPAWFGEIEAALDARPVRRSALSGGSIATVEAVELEDGRRIVVKTGASGLALEARMLTYLAEVSRLPVPKVLLALEGLLAMEFVPGSTHLDSRAEEHAAELLADLHGVSAGNFGFDYETVIGGLPQPNPETRSWIEFFRDQRLVHMARDCHESGEFDARFLRRIERLAEKLDDLLEEPQHPSLIHGDMWGGNILSRNGRITGFLDPAIYFAHAEIELAFSTLFGTFSEPFFRRYDEIRPIRPGFFEIRKDIYNLWHLLTHVRLFGAGYIPGIERVLTRHGV